MTDDLSFLSDGKSPVIDGPLEDGEYTIRFESCVLGKTTPQHPSEPAIPLLCLEAKILDQGMKNGRLLKKDYTLQKWDRTPDENGVITPILVDNTYNLGRLRAIALKMSSELEEASDKMVIAALLKYLPGKTALLELGTRKNDFNGKKSTERTWRIDCFEYTAQEPLAY
jgi:hypothetical protein